MLPRQAHTLERHLVKANPDRGKISFGSTQRHLRSCWPR